ncbi:Cell division protein FtsW [uncultured Roseburia sp.]|uniref:Probable peptidoglycan glycosyltransferase FtsW n=1 Tax=Brotonthovivens ammoniilytica TaxID=2981725 RepID=A0ABT2TFG2_9FIRM|nr:putative peptidoglycan glycosyltransferase FtsW [Brotonthovivens ammoniilytica]MCU6760928.1 putative lipid II flippase FtsW [Brotonthovivens ammoniilytica]SCI13690.1 Cell division protein FtsW [uncultured Roseburia sp.]
MGRNSRTGKPEKIKYFDYSLLFIIIFLVGFGLVMLYSVSSYEAQSTFGNSAYYLKKQLGSVVLGLIAMFIVSRIEYHFWQRFSLLFYAIALLLCLAVIFVGEDINGSKRWLRVGGVSLQPSELAKIGIIIFVAAVLCKTVKQVSKLKNVIKVFCFAAPIILVIAINNLSTAIIVAGIAFIMVFVVSPKYSHFIGMIVIAAVGVVGVTIMQGSYRAVRITAWLHPEQYPDDAYQTLQGLYAIGSGGLFGKGLGASMQKLGYVPEAQNDMIFTIICEELGLFGAICVILLFILMIWRFMVIANNAADLYGSLLVIGIMAHISLQVLLNISVVTNTIPNTGITLPFISYGGTSVAILLTEMGVALSVSRGIRFDENKQIE